jgi:murein DD-endopeptidase MepM/ murein hydrolase activator NlpD
MEERPMNKKKYIAAVSCLVAGLIGFGSVYVTEMNVKQQEEQNVEQTAESATQEESAVTSHVVEPKTMGKEQQNSSNQTVEQEAADTPLTEDAAEVAVETTEAEEPVYETAKNVNSLHFEVGEGLVWPLEGDVLLNYSMDATTYFPTLDQYRYNPAIVISGEVNDTVLLVAKGQITDITINEVTGCTVTEDLGDGYTAIYGQLKEVNFEVGDMVNAGQVIGYVSEPTKYYSVEGSNLYFAMEKDGEPVNPMEYFQ